MSGKHRKSLAAVAAIIFLGVLAGGCPQARKALEQAVKPPIVSLKDYSIAEVSTTHLTVILHLEVFNPNPIGLRLSKIEYTIELAGHPLISGVTTDGLDLQANAASEADVSVNLVYSEVLKVYEDARAVDEIPYTISGKVTIDTPLGPLPIPFKSQGMMPVVRPPKLISIGIEVGDYSFSGVDLVVKLTLENPNGFPVDIRYINYALFLEDKPFSSGQVVGKPIPPHASETLGIPVSFQFGSAGSWLVAYITQGEANYLLQFDAAYTLIGDPVKQSEEWRGTAKFWK